MVITRANIIGTIIPTITGDTLTIMGITATHTKITATLVALGSALVFNSTNPKPGCFGSRNRKYSDEITKSNSNYSRERDDGRLSTTTRSTAAELRPLVVVGIPLEDVAITYPVPTYPRNAQVLRIGGIVRLLVQVERGEIVDIATHSGPPLLAHFSERWVRNNWQFKPSTNGQYLLPISYEPSS